MKKFICFFLILSLFFVLPAMATETDQAATEEVLVAAAVNDDGSGDTVSTDLPEDSGQPAPFPSLMHLYEHWYSTHTDDSVSPYPDYVCGVWSETGSTEQLVVAVTKDEAGEAGKAEILALIEDDSSVEFTYMSYSHNQLWQVKEELFPYMGEESGLIGMGIHEMDNYVSLDFDKNNPNSEAFIAQCFEKYGNMVHCNLGDLYDITVEDSADIGGGSVGTASWLRWVIFACLLAALGGFGLVIYHRQSAVRQTVEGGTVTGGMTTRKQVTQAVKSSAVTPPRTTLDDIFSKLDNT